MAKKELHPLGIISTPDGGLHLKRVEHGWETISEIVDGFIEIVRTPFLPPNVIMFVDDEGKLKGKDINDLASCYYGYGLKHSEIIVGTVFFIGETEDGEDFSLTNTNIKDIFNANMYLCEMLNRPQKHRDFNEWYSEEVKHL